MSVTAAALDDAVADRDFAHLSDREIRSALTMWAGRLAAGEARFVELA